jgi:pyruvate/2-oxoglutarate/acetoin dehydrogenase E1 component
MPSVLESLNSALHQAFADNDKVYLLGEDVLDPYGGAFKVTRGLSTLFPERVNRPSPKQVSSAWLRDGISGLHPLWRSCSRFHTLIADQLESYKKLLGLQRPGEVPIVIRTP